MPRPRWEQSPLLQIGRPQGEKPVCVGRRPAGRGPGWRQPLPRSAAEVERFPLLRARARVVSRMNGTDIRMFMAGLNACGLQRKLLITPLSE